MLSRVLSAAREGAGSTGSRWASATTRRCSRRGRAARLVWTVDEQVEGTHFRRDLVSWHDVGWRSFMAAASDVAAMGAEPWCALSALVVPDDVDDAALEQLARGQQAAAHAVGAPVVGGNLARGARAVDRDDPPRDVRARGPAWRRDAGRRALDGGPRRARRGGAARARRGKGRSRAPAGSHRRLADAAGARGRGARDGARRARRDRRVRRSRVRRRPHGRGERRRAPSSTRARFWPTRSSQARPPSLGASALDLALYGGEDYALVVASPVAVDGFRRIGEVTEGSGVALRGANGQRPIEPRGFDHFTSGKPREASGS